MTAGVIDRDLDLAVATEIMEMVPCSKWRAANMGSAGGPVLFKECAHEADGCYPTRTLGSVGGIPPFSSKMDRALEVADRVSGRWRAQGFLLATMRDGRKGWFAAFFRPSSTVHSNVVEFGAEGTGAAHAVCLAALEYVRRLPVGYAEGVTNPGSRASL